jgi:hypothetical protein
MWLLAAEIVAVLWNNGEQADLRDFSRLQNTTSQQCGTVSLPIWAEGESVPEKSGRAVSTKTLAREYSPQLRSGIIHHARFLVENHGLATVRIAWRPGQSGPAGTSCACEVFPCRGHLARQRLRFRCVAGALFAPFSVIEAEG